MKTIKPLVETNPYLRDPNDRSRYIARSVRTSCGVEGIRQKSIDSQPIEIKVRIPKRIYEDN